MFVNFFKLLVSFLIVAGLMAVYGVPLSITMIELLPMLVGLFIITFGVCIILSHFGVFVEDLANVINILLKLAFYFSGIFYSVSTRIPAPYGKIMAKINPVAFVIEEARKVLLYSTHMDVKFLAVWYVIGIALCAIGVVMIYKNENNYVKVMNG